MRKTTSSLDPRPEVRPAAGRFAPALTACLAVVALATAISGFTAPPAAAQSPQCAAREALLDRLSSKYQEEPVGIGVTASGSLLEVLASPSGSWTIIVTVPGGPTCLVSAGDGWRTAPVQLAKDPAA